MRALTQPQSSACPADIFLEGRTGASRTTLLASKGSVMIEAVLASTCMGGPTGPNMPDGGYIGAYIATPPKNLGAPLN